MLGKKLSLDEIQYMIFDRTSARPSGQEIYNEIERLGGGSGIAVNVVPMECVECGEILSPFGFSYVEDFEMHIKHHYSSKHNENFEPKLKIY